MPEDDLLTVKLSASFSTSATILCQLVTEERYGLEVANPLGLEPPLDLPHTGVRVGSGQNVSSFRHGVSTGVKAPENLGKFRLVFADELHRFLTKFPMATFFTGIIDDLESLRLELEAQAQIGLLVVRRDDHKARRDL